jgi:hypothetical protein
MLHPTLSTDDVIRLVNLIEHPLRDLMFWACNEHLAVFFDLVSWSTWQVIGHDLRLAPLAYCAASVLAWVVVLVLLGRWLVRETGSRTAALVALAIVAQSPLVMNTVWWYSASSFSWAIASILLALLGAGAMAQRPVRSLLLVGLGTALGPAGTSLGHLAMPLAILRGLVEPKASRRAKLLLIAVAIGGETAYMMACHHWGPGVFATARRYNAQMADPVSGLGLALTVPPRLLVPSAMGLPASWCATTLPAWLSWGAGILALASLVALAVWPRARWDRRLVLVGAAMIYLGYALTYAARAGLVTQGKWTAEQLIYRNATRYHVLPLLGLSAVLAALLAAWRPIRRCDARRGLPALVGAVVSLVVLAVQHQEVETWTDLFRYPDQRATLAALERVGRVAREEGITRAQLVRIVAPALRSWNAPLLTDTTYAFPLMKLVEAPEQLARPRTDDEARRLLRARLTPAERRALGSGACASLSPGRPGADAVTLAIARRIELNDLRQDRPGRYRSDRGPGSLKCIFDPTAGARFLELPGLRTDQELVISWCHAGGKWRPGHSFRWLASPPPAGPPVVNLESLIHWSEEPITEIAIQLTRAGEIALEAPPRLLR